MRNIYLLIAALLVLSGCDPVVLITAPEWGTEFDAGEAVTFTCTANDVEDGTLSGDALVWESDLDGQIGTGSPLTSDNLTQGTHMITLTATDSDGNFNFDLVGISVGAPSGTTTSSIAGSSSTTTIVSGSVTDYYVAPDGNDSNPGTQALPWASIQQAADILQAGERVYIRAGTYSERVAPQNSGSAGNEIIYAAYPGELPVINGSAISLSSGQDGLITIADKQYITISGLKITHAGPGNNHCGIFIDGSSHITIEKCYTYNTLSSGIGVWDCDHIIIDGNEVELACNNGEQECITIAGTDTFEVRNNHVHHSGPGTIGGEGIDAKDGSSNGKIYANHVHDLNNRVGIYVDSWDKSTSNIEAYRNIVHDIKNNDGFTLAAESGGLLENIKIYNNIAYNNELNGISISENGGRLFKHPMRDIRIINNTFANNGSSRWGAAILVENAEAEDVIIRNNICSQNVFAQIQLEKASQSVTVENNLINGFRNYAEEVTGDNHVDGDPLFSNVSQADFRLLEASPAIDAGSSDGAPSEDYNGTPRPQGAGVDIGAFEFTDE